MPRKRKKEADLAMLDEPRALQWLNHKVLEVCYKKVVERDERIRLSDCGTKFVAKLRKLNLSQIKSLKCLPYKLAEYCVFVTLRPWINAEEVITESPVATALYCTMRGPWPEYEHLISTSPEASYTYARILRKRWPKGEEAILKDSWYAKEYATNILRARWKKAEPVLLQNPHHAIDYCSKLMDGQRWRKLENVILDDSSGPPCWSEIWWYAHKILKKPWPKAEKLIGKITIDDISGVRAYIRDFRHGSWPKANKVVLDLLYKSERSRDLYSTVSLYLDCIPFTSWPDLEQYIKDNKGKPHIKYLADLYRRWQTSRKDRPKVRETHNDESSTTELLYKHEGP